MQEINELKNLVVQSLESHGVLGQLRAQIRSSVFKIIDMQEVQNNKRPNSFYWENPYCQKIHETDCGREAVELIMELLQFYKMEYSLNVFPHESNLTEEIKREKIVQKMGLNDTDKNVPLLIQILRNSLGKKDLKEEKSAKLIKEEFPKDNVNKFPPQKEKEEPIKKEIKQTQKEPEQKKVPEPPPPPKEKEQEKQNLFKKKEENKNFKLMEELPEIPPRKPQNMQPLPIVEKKQEIPPPKKDEKKNIYNQEPIDNFDLSQEKRGLAEVKNKMGDLGKKIQNKQIAELSASQKSDKIEKSLSQLSDKNQEYSMKKKVGYSSKSNEYANDNYDDDNEEVGEEIYVDEDNENLEELMAQQRGHGQEGMEQGSEEMFAASQSQGFDIMVNSTTLEEYDYYEDVINP